MGSPVVLGVDFGGSKIAAAVADLSGPRLGQVVTNVEPADDAARTFVRGIDAAQRLLGTVAVDRQLVAVAACTFGIPHDDRVELAPTINGWEQLPFGALLQAAFPHARVQFATDVKAAARAELDDGALAGCEVGL
jgi:glucokinase